MDVEAFDRELGEGRVSQEALRQLWDAECYGAATTMTWLEKRLRILYVLAASGRIIEVFDAKANGVKCLTTPAELDAWCAEKFPEAHACFFAEKPPGLCP